MYGWVEFSCVHATIDVLLQLGYVSSNSIYATQTCVIDFHRVLEFVCAYSTMRVHDEASSNDVES